MKIMAELQSPGVVDGSQITLISKELPLKPGSPQCFEFQDDTIVMVMSRLDAENFYEQGHNNFEGCTDWEEYADALKKVGIGKKDYDVEIEVTMRQYVNITVENADNEEDAYEKAVDYFNDNPTAYLDTSCLDSYEVEPESATEY